MFTVQIEHPIHDFDGWRAAFDRDPAGRETSGVRRYRIFRPVDDPKFVIIDLDFDTDRAAHAFASSPVSSTMRIDGRADGPDQAGPSPRIIFIAS